MKHKILLSALSLLGFSSCSDGNGLVDIPVMYGVLPPSDFYCVGEVTDTSGNPLFAINISLNAHLGPDITYTSPKEGAFSCGFSNDDLKDSNTITFLDADEYDNGGYFATTTVDLDSIEPTIEEGIKVYDLGKIELGPKIKMD